MGHRIFKLGVLETGTALLLRSARTGKHTLTTTHAVIDIQGKQGLSRQKYISYIYTSIHACMSLLYTTIKI